MNAQQTEQELPLSVDEVVFVGRHIYQRRIVGDGYTIDDVLDQIESALCEASVVIANEYNDGYQEPSG